MRDYEYEEKLEDPAKIVICIEGGLIQWTAATEPVEIAIVNLDIESAPTIDFTRVTLHRGPTHVFAQILTPDDKPGSWNSIDSHLVNSIFEEIKASQKTERKPESDNT